MTKFIIKCWNRLLLLFRKIEVGYEVLPQRPPLTKVRNAQITFVGDKHMLKWALVKCPCGCGDVLNLSLMKTHTPNWEVEFDKMKRVTLSPSLWKNDGCRSHFFIRKGKIIWAKD